MPVLILATTRCIQGRRRRDGRALSSVSGVGGFLGKIRSMVLGQCGTMALQVLNKIDQFPTQRVLNLNVPGMPLEQIRGIQATRLGIVKWVRIPSSQQILGARIDSGLISRRSGRALEGTDFWAIEHGYASLTVVQPDMTDPKHASQIRRYGRNPRRQQ